MSGVRRVILYIYTVNIYIYIYTVYIYLLYIYENQITRTILKRTKYKKVKWHEIIRNEKEKKRNIRTLFEGKNQSYKRKKI